MNAYINDILVNDYLTGDCHVDHGCSGPLHLLLEGELPQLNHQRILAQLRTFPVHIIFSNKLCKFLSSYCYFFSLSLCRYLCCLTNLSFFGRGRDKNAHCLAITQTVFVIVSFFCHTPTVVYL